ncbi:MAG: HD domain-containing protein [Candidatus Acetothermia bacterium]|jgi:PAS domain S-box-containing protein/putative nucleotidyltransferase with HDIG domain|nr:HD domain-containing protein [Candidatus Acetothermia bacterium]
MSPELHTIGILFRGHADRRLIREFLEGLGYRVLAPRPDGFDPAGWAEVDLVLAEAAVARRRTEELLDLKARAAANFALLLVLVVLPPGEDPTAWLAAGFDDWVSLPITKEALNARVQVWLRLRDAEGTRFRSLVEETTIGFYRTTPDGRILYANPALVRMLGFSSFAELARRNLEEEGFAPSYPRADFKERVEREGRVVGLEAAWIRLDGTPIYVRESARAVRDEEGQVLYYEGTVEDLTEKKEFEEKLRAAQALVSQLLFIHDPNEVARLVVDTARDVLGLEDCGFYLLKDGKLRLLAHSSGALPGPTELPLQSARGIVPLVARTGEAVYLADLGEDARYIRTSPENRSELCVPIKVGGRVLGVLNAERPEPDGFAPVDRELLEALAGVVALALENARLFSQAARLPHEIVEVLSAALELRDPHTAGHQRRVAELACAIARELGFSEERIQGLQVAVLLHDIGKMLYVPAEILCKPGKLSAQEMELVRIHPQAGYEVLRRIEFPWPVAEVVRQHHERLDGSGYPHGLKGEEILLEARILAVADVVEAMTSHRPYRPALGVDQALAEIQKEKGRLYDPQVVEACLAVFERRFVFPS